MTAMSPQRILVVGINYAPEHAGIAPYTTAVCEALAARGHEVTVLAGLPSYPSWTVPADYRGRLQTQEIRSGVDVRRLWHYVPGRQTAMRRGLYELSFGVHAALRGAPRAPDLVLSVVPSLLGGLAAARAARRAGAPLAVWVQDLMGPAAEQSGIVGGARVAAVAKTAEKRLLRAADRVAVIHDAFTDYVVDQGVAPQRVTTVKNWSHVAAPTRARDEVRRLMGWPEGTLIALHTGNMGAKQALENVVEAGRLAQDETAEVRFVLMGEGSERTHLEYLAAGVSSVQFAEPVADDLYSDVLAAADVLLLNERGTAVEMSLPSKLTSYDIAGRPVVAAVPSGGATAQEVRDRSLGDVIAPEQPHALLNAVLGAHTRIASQDDIGSRGSQAALLDWLLIRSRQRDAEITAS